ncbi:uncharacterized protein LOC135202862 [Macrobrachium nipponense]|uniref:uncharacterized protein LOC135202862 n=1 Tax=Macrobrachium nipponense TaxID=159736 RepID=UPI0030C7CCE3
MSLLRQIANICGCGEPSSNIIDDTCDYGIPRSNIFNDDCSYAIRHGNIALKLVLFLGTVFTLFNIGRKLISLWNGTPELTLPDVSEGIPDDDDIPGKNAVSALNEVYKKNLENLDVEMELLRGENSRLRATLLEKEILFDEMTENIDSLRRRVIDDFQGRMDRLDDKNSQLRMEQLERSREAEEFEQIIGRFEEEVQALTESKRKLETEKERQMSDLKEKIRDLQVENMDKDKVIENLNGNNIQCEEIKNRLQGEVRNLGRQNTEMEINMAHLKKEKTEVEKKMADLGKEFEKEVHDLEHRLSNYQDIIIEKDAEIEIFNKEATEKEEKIEALGNIVQNLLEENKKIKNAMEYKINDLSQELSKQQDLNKKEVEKFEKEMFEFGQTIEGLESEVVSLMKENDSLKTEKAKEISDLISLNMEKEEQLEQFKTEAVACAQTIEGLENEVVALMKEKGSLKIEMEKEISDLISLNMEKEEQLEQFKAEAIACAQTIEGLENEVVALMKEKGSLKIEMEKEISDLISLTWKRRSSWNSSKQKPWLVHKQLKVWKMRS